MSFSWGSHFATGALVASAALAVSCGSDFANGTTEDGGGAGNDGSASEAGVEGGSDGGASEAGAEACTKLGDVRFCKALSGDGAQTCITHPDKSTTWGRCVPTSCDANAKPGTLPEEACFPAGNFTMGGLDGTNGLPNEGDTLPAHEVTIRRRFYVDQYEATVEEFDAWWNKNPRPIPTSGDLVFASGAGDELHWAATWTPSAPGTDLGFACTSALGQPKASINCITFETALAYCMSRGKRLPTEAEWEYVAAGMTKRNPFPWGTSPAPDDTCTWTIDKPCYQQHKPLWPFTRGVTKPGDTVYGSVNNLAGNVAEWTLDFYPDSGCTQSNVCWPAGKPDPMATTDYGFGRVVRGGSWQSDADQVRGQARAYMKPTSATTSPVGVRCVRDEWN